MLYTFILAWAVSVLSVTHTHSHMHAHTIRVLLGGLAAAGRGLRGQESKGGQSNYSLRQETDKAEDTQAERGT